MVWSEHVAVLRFISCTEDELFFSQFEDYTIPRSGQAEDVNYELSLLKCYNAAINMKQLKPGSIPFKIAEYYLANKWSKLNKYPLVISLTAEYYIKERGRNG